MTDHRVDQGRLIGEEFSTSDGLLPDRIVVLNEISEIIDSNLDPIFSDYFDAKTANFLFSTC